MTIFDNSRYQRTVVVRLTNTEGEAVKPPYLDVVQRVPSDYADNETRLVEQSDTWPSVALEHLADPSGWWAIAEVSGVIDPFTEMNTGELLLVPSINRYLFTFLGG